MSLDIQFLFKKRKWLKRAEQFFERKLLLFPYLSIDGQTHFGDVSQGFNEQRLSRNHQKTLQRNSHHIPILRALGPAASGTKKLQKPDGRTIYLDF